MLLSKHLISSLAYVYYGNEAGRASFLQMDSRTYTFYSITLRNMQACQFVCWCDCVFASLSVRLLIVCVCFNICCVKCVWFVYFCVLCDFVFMVTCLCIYLCVLCFNVFVCRLCFCENVFCLYLYVYLCFCEFSICVFMFMYLLALECICML